MGRVKIVGAAVGAVVVLLAAVLVGRATVSDDQDEASQILVPRPVERRTLRDTLTVSGELRREELQTINSAVDGKVSSVRVEDGDTVNVGDALFDLDGRSAIAVDGEFAFFRNLDVGSDGPDVEQLEAILTDQGYDVGRVDRLFTEETRRGLAQWQFDRGYGGFTPETDEAITISLGANSAGYTVGKQNSIAVIVGPNVPTGGGDVVAEATHRAQTATLRAGGTKPVITVAVSPKQVDEGGTLTFTFTADPAPTTDLTIDLTVGGDATAGDDSDDGDYAAVADTFVFPAGRTAHQVRVKTFVDDVIETDEEVELSLTPQFNDNGFYVVGPINSATGVIRANGQGRRPILTIETDSDVIDEGQAATITIEADVERNDDYDIPLVVTGSATPGQDFTTIDDVTMTAGSTSVDVAVNSRADGLVETDENVTVALGPSTQFTPALLDAVNVEIRSLDLPELTLVGGGTVAEGGAATFTILSDQPLSEATSVVYQVAGSAQAGSDFDVLTGTATMPAGATSLSVPIRTIDDDVVFLPSDMIVADWPAQVGSVDVDDGEFVLQGNPVLTLTEPTYTVNLSVSASDRAELEIGQPVIVDIAAGDQSSEGVISELDDSATVDEAGNEIYEGVIDVEDALTAVDGASVSIDVVLDERVDALAVPVASVLQESGGRVVRTLADDGTIERVEVEVGLVDDEYIEVTSGLREGDIVIVGVEEESEAEGG